MAPWLTARPIAHRGLHDRAAGRCENTLSAAAVAARRGFAVECDVQLSSDGDAMVFHDATLDRLTAATGRVADYPARTLTEVAVGGTQDGIPRLTDLLHVLDARVPLVCEVKSAFDGDNRLADRTVAILRAYSGPVAVKSFDPAVLAHLRQGADALIPLGIVAEGLYDDPEWSMLPHARKRELAALSHFDQTRPDFLSFAVNDLPHAAATLMRAGLGRPVMAWTVRTPAQRENAARWADQIVFEGFEPDDTPHPGAFV